MSGECDLCGEHTTECTCKIDLLDCISDIVLHKDQLGRAHVGLCNTAVLNSLIIISKKLKQIEARLPSASPDPSPDSSESPPSP